MNPRNVLEVDHSKAGMQTADKATVERIVNEMSKNSAFYANEQRKQEGRDKRVAKLLRLSAEFDLLPPQKLAELKQAVDAEVNEEIIGCAHVARYAHADMDAFHASVEELDQPHLKTVPMAVGGMAMLGTSNYIARRSGVRAAMPGHIAKRLCPELVIVPPHYEKYERATEKVRAQARRIDPDFVSHGGDELCIKLDRKAFENAADLINERRRMGMMETTFENQQQQQQKEGHITGEVTWNSITEAEVVTEFRKRINEATQLTASIGIGPTRMLAKIASNFNKPDGQFILECRTVPEIQKYTWENLSVRQIPGIGKVTDQMLQRLGITNCKELFDNRYRIRHCFLLKTFSFLLAASVGLCGAVKSSKMKNRHHGFFVKHPSLKKKLEQFDKREINQGNADNDDDDDELAAMTASQRKLNLDYSSSDADSDDEELVAHQNPAKDTHKHSVGCERTFHGIVTKQDAVALIRRVYTKSIERLLHVTPCRVYQIVVKAKRTNYEITNVSASVDVTVNKKIQIKQEKMEGEENEEQEQEGKIDGVKREEKSEWEEEEQVASTPDQINALIDGFMSLSDFEMMLEKFSTMCESVGFTAAPKNFRLMGCRFAFQPGLFNNNSTESAMKVTTSGKEQQRNIKSNNSEISNPTTLPRRRQRTLDEFLHSSNKNVDGKSNTNKAKQTETINLDDEDENDDDEVEISNRQQQPQRKASKKYTVISISDDGNEGDGEDEPLLVDDDEIDFEHDEDEETEIQNRRNMSLVATNKFSNQSKNRRQVCDDDAGENEIVTLTISSGGPTQKEDEQEEREEPKKSNGKQKSNCDEVIFL